MTSRELLRRAAAFRILAESVAAAGIVVFGWITADPELLLLLGGSHVLTWSVVVVDMVLANSTVFLLQEPWGNRRWAGGWSQTKLSLS